MEMIESITTRIEYLTSRQVTSCENGDLVKRNLNFSPFRETATFCQPFKISLRIKMNKRTSIAILNPSKSCITLEYSFHKTSGDLKVSATMFQDMMGEPEPKLSQVLVFPTPYTRHSYNSIVQTSLNIMSTTVADR
jgi:hypothetical protein